MRRLLRSNLLFVAGALSAASSSHAIEYFVDASVGVDSASGSALAPWATLARAATAVNPGDIITVRAGNYRGAEFTRSGTAALPITLRAALGALVSINQDISAARPDGINLEGASHMLVEGFTINGRGRAGIRAVLCNNVTIRNNQMDANGRWGILTGFCNDLRIENNVATNSVIEHGIYVSNSGDRPVIRNNLISGNNANGIHMNGDLSAGGDGVISDALVENNIIFNNGTAGGSGINMDGVQNSLIRNNLIYGSRASGISLYQIDGGQASTGNRVLNNTVIIASSGRWALNIQDAAINNTVRNNIILNDHPTRGAIDISSSSLPGFSSNNNVAISRFTINGGSTILNLAQWQAQTGQDTNSRVAGPSQLFVAALNFRLSPTSPAIDAGELRADVPSDLEGNPRPSGSTHDIGAYEANMDAIYRNGFE
jgi:parallel beta-helix repeat protein